MQAIMAVREEDVHAPWPPSRFLPALGLIVLAAAAAAVLRVRPRAADQDPPHTIAIPLRVLAGSWAIAFAIVGLFLTKSHFTFHGP